MGSTLVLGHQEYNEDSQEDNGLSSGNKKYWWHPAYPIIPQMVIQRDNVISSKQELQKNMILKKLKSQLHAAMGVSGSHTDKKRANKTFFKKLLKLSRPRRSSLNKLSPQESEFASCLADYLFNMAMTEIKGQDKLSNKTRSAQNFIEEELYGCLLHT